jgi:putative FmdB family regulatory protein
MTFDYECPRGHRFERTAPIGKAPDSPRCPECGSKSRRIYSPPAIRFKGTGFHSTDYGPGSPKE